MDSGRKHIGADLAYVGVADAEEVAVEMHVAGVSQTVDG